MAKRKRIAKSSSSGGIMHLPEDVLVDILVRIPLENLHKKLIFVCKTWASIILRNPIFAKRHALHAEPGLLLKEISNFASLSFREFKKGKFKLRNYNFNFPRGDILGSSGGVVLFYNYNYRGTYFGGSTFHVVNPYIGCVMQLPPPRDTLDGTFDRYSNIGVIPCSGIVKVVIPGLDSKGMYYWGVLTLGVDVSWRSIPSTLQEPTDRSDLYYQKLISVGGVMFSKYRWNRADRCIHAIDLRDETARFFQVPKELGDGKSWLIEMGEHLCCIVQEGPGWTVHNVWILRDLNQNIWVQLYRIDLHFKENIGNHPPEPIGWLDNNRSLVFNVRKRIRARSSVIVAYNVTTGEKIKCSRVKANFKVWLHKNTLILYSLQALDSPVARIPTCSHLFREGNQCVDILAMEGKEHI